MERKDEASERKRRWPAPGVVGLLALFASTGLHVVVFLFFVGSARLPAPDMSSATAELLVDVTVPGLGPPGAPAGDLANVQEADPLAEELDAPVMPPPRAERPSTVDATETAPTELSPEGEPAEVAETASEAGAVDGDAFIDSLIARPRAGTGAGAGGNGGAGCEDPIEGVWHVRKYRSGEGWWTTFTLHIERDGDELRGRVVQHGWNGNADDQSPPACTPGMFEHRVEMFGEGFVHGDQVRFDAVGPPRRTVLCRGLPLGYNLDHFTGTVRGNRLLAVNNDGGRDVNAPYVFRRTSCR